MAPQFFSYYVLNPTTGRVCDAGTILRKALMGLTAVQAQRAVEARGWRWERE